ncbi:MAG: acyl-CoA thioesterase [bacterium]
MTRTDKPVAMLQRLIQRLQLTPGDTDVFLGGSGSGGVTANERLFGGLVAAQAAMAAMRTVDEFPIHSLHSYFLRPGRPDADIEFHVTRIKEGRNFAARSVAAWQRGALIFQLQASFQRPTSGVHHQPAPPDVPAAQMCPNRDALRGRKNWQDMPLDVRMVTPLTETQPLPAQQHIWLGVNGALPAEQKLHTALLVYASDRCLLDTAWRPHADKGQMTGASLDHSMWFHQPVDFGDWLLYATESPAAAAGRGLALGNVYSAAGQHIATVAQEGVMRL